MSYVYSRCVSLCVSYIQILFANKKKKEIYTRKANPNPLCMVSPSHFIPPLVHVTRWQMLQWEMIYATWLRKYKQDIFHCEKQYSRVTEPWIWSYTRSIPTQDDLPWVTEAMLIELACQAWHLLASFSDHFSFMFMTLNTASKRFMCHRAVCHWTSNPTLLRTAIHSLSCFIVLQNIQLTPSFLELSLSWI